MYRLLWCLSGKATGCNAEDPGLIPGSGRSPGEWNDYPLQYSCLENSMDKGAWQVHGVPKELDMTEQLTLSLHFSVYLKVFFIDL